MTEEDQKLENGDNDMTDHDLLIRIDTRLSSQEKHFTNHIRHHWMISVPMVMVALGLLIALLTK